MSQWSQASLTPSRPAPAPPGARNAGQLSASRPAPKVATGASAFPSPFSLQRNASGLEGNRAVVRRGAASVKEEGLRSFLWSKKWLVLTATELQIYKNEVCLRSVCSDLQQSATPSYVCQLADVLDVLRVDTKPFCLEVESKDKLLYLGFRADDELYAWMEDIYSRSPGGVSQPTNFVHQVHVGFDPVSGGFTVRCCWAICAD